MVDFHQQSQSKRERNTTLPLQKQVDVGMVLRRYKASSYLSPVVQLAKKPKSKWIACQIDLRVLL